MTLPHQGQMMRGVQQASHSRSHRLSQQNLPVADMGRVSPTQDRWIDDDSRPGSSLGARRLDAQAPYAWL